MSTHGKPVGCAAQNANPSKLQAMARDQNFTLGRLDAAIVTMRSISNDTTLDIATGLRLEATTLVTQIHNFKARLAHEYEYQRYREREHRTDE